MSRNIFNNETETSIGERLLNIQSLNIAQDQVPVLGLNNIVEGVNISSYGKTLLNETSISSLRNAILEADTSIEITDTAIGEINLNVDNNLKLQILADKSIFHNDILVDNIKRKTDDTSAISIEAGNITLQKAMTIFRDSTSNDKGYVRVQNSTTNKSGYIDFMTGENDRVAYLGQGEENDLLKTGNFLYLGMENQCGFSINDGVTPIFQVSLENDKIDLNYTTNANGDFIMKNDNAHKEINNNNNKPLLKLPTSENYSANLYGEDANNGLMLSKTSSLFKIDGKIAGADKDIYIPKTQCDTLTANTSITTPTIIAQTFKSKQGDSEILFQNNGATHNIRFIPGAINYIQSSSNTLTFSKNGDGAEQIKIDHNNLAPHNTGTLISNYNISIRPPTGNLKFNLFRCPSNEQVSLYSHTNTDVGFVLQKSANDNGIKINMYHDSNYRPMYFNSSNSSQMVIGSEAVQTATERFVVVSSSRFINGLTSGADIDLTGTSKLHFSSNNYLQNDANHNLNLHLNNNKNFIANTGDTTSSYDFQIDDVSKLKITDTETTISNKLITPIINTTNIKFTGETTDAIELKSNEIRVKKPLYVEYANRKITLQAGATDNVIYNKNSGLNLGFNIAYNPTGEVETITTSSQNTSKVLIDNAGVSLLVSNTINALPSNVLVASASAITCSKDVNIQGTSVKLNFNSNNYLQNDGSNHLNLFVNSSKNFVANTGNDVSIYDFKINSVSKLKITDTETTISNNLQTPSLISSTNTTTNQCRLDLDDLLGTFVFRDNAGVEKSILIGSYNALVANVQITANQGILMTSTLNSRDVIPTGDGQYDLGSSSQHFKDIYATNNVIDTSDRNKKKDIQPIQGGLQTIMKLKPVSYKFKDGQSGRVHTGFIAQDCKDTYIKDWAGYVETDGKHYGLRYAQFISLNTQAIQELYKIVENKTSIQTNYKQGVEEHKCDNYQLITQLNSYEVQLLQNEEKLNKMDKFLEEVIEDKEKIEIEMKTHKTQNSILEKRVIDLENKLQIIENKQEDIDESDGGINMIELLQSRNHELELKYTKLETKMKKLTSIVNKIVKNSN